MNVGDKVATARAVSVVVSIALLFGGCGAPVQGYRLRIPGVEYAPWVYRLLPYAFWEQVGVYANFVDCERAASFRRSIADTVLAQKGKKLRTEQVLQVTQRWADAGLISQEERDQFRQPPPRGFIPDEEYDPTAGSIGQKALRLAQRWRSASCEVVR